MRIFRSLALALLSIGFLSPAAFAQLDGDLSKVHPHLKMEAYRLVGKPLPKGKIAETKIKDAPDFTRPLEWGKVKPGVKPLEEPTLLTTQKRGDQIYLDTFIELTPGASTDNLSPYGVILGARSGDIVTADILPGMLDEVNALPEVVRITGSRRVSLMNDAATADTGVQTAWNSLGYRGNGVMVGVCDSGIDWTHEDFKYGNGQTRIVSIWDQTDTGGPNPTGYAYGSVWTRQQINDGVSRQQDNDEGAGGHGTHVTGTAAGDGSATGNGQPAGRFTGVANEAEIAFVKGNLSDQGIADAAAWLYSIADQEGKPMAVNLSLGSINGPHDGSEPVEQFLDGLIGGPGRALCISAGNSGGQTVHASSVLGPTTGDGNSLNDSPVLAFGAYNAPPDQIKFSFVAMEFWYPAGTTVEWRPIWDNDGLVAGQWMGTESNTVDYQLNSGSLNGVQMQAVAQVPYNDGRNLLNHGSFFAFSPQGAAALNGLPFYIQLKGEGVLVHSWYVVRDQGSFIPAAAFGTPPAKLIEPDTEFLVGSPGNSSEAITVASYVSKVNWTDVDGGAQTQQGATLADISGFSSPGPRRDGNSTIEQQKPDIAGPGEAVISALSSVLTQRPRSDIERDGVHQKLQGTSMSSPVITGIAALMFQKNPALTQSDIKTLLRNTARDAGTAGWDPIWGAGKVDAVAAINAVSGGTVVRGDVDGNAVINSADAIRVLRHIGGQQALTGNALTAGDADESGAVDNADADWILEKNVGLR